MLMNALRERMGAGPRGFSLLEVMITVLVVSFGLLGLAAVQALAISNTQVASAQSIFAIEAQSMASRLQANSAYWAAGAFPSQPVTVQGNVLSDSTLNGMQSNCASVSCTAQQMAGYDLKSWGSSLSQTLPGASGIVACTPGINSTTPPTCTITVNYTQMSNIALNQGTLSSSASVPSSYTMSVQL
jgi:type IV pilus assembly protein PilV